MSVPLDVPTALNTLLDTANEHEHPVIRAVAIRAGLLTVCRCRWANAVGVERCGNCGARVLVETELRTAEAVGLRAVRNFLEAVHGKDGDARFVDACRGGSCGTLAVEVADTAVTGAEQHGYSGEWFVLAEEILAEVEIRSRAPGREVSR